MNIITLDFESYYSQTYSLSKLTTEEYVRGAEFEVIGVSVKVNDDETQWFSGTYADTKKFLEGFNFDDNLALAHNAMFDAAILTWRFGIHPRGWLDTLSMARAIHSTEVGGSLDKLTQHYGLGQKGTAVMSAIGKHRLDFTPHDLAEYGEYCINDVELTRKLFDCMSPEFPALELRLIDLTIRMFSEPVLELSPTLLHDHIEKQKSSKELLLRSIDMDSRDGLMSNERFAKMLQEFNVDPPRKISPVTGKETWAFSKTDEGFKELLEHPNQWVQMLAAARVGLKSTQEETRAQRFLDIAGRGKLPIPLRYYAAHTGRWGGDDKVNMQNLGRSSPLKNAILAPTGYIMIDSDSSQIEARTVAWLAGQDDLVQAFEDGKDVYKIMASAIYGKAESEITKEERFVGKTTILGCFGADTKVLTNVGWKCIVEVQATDLLWDGEEWVAHQGVIPKGLREVITAYGVDATPDHEILTEHGWREWCEVTTNPSLFQSALHKANSQSLTGSSTSNRLENQQGGTPLFGVSAGGKDLSIDTTLKPNVLLDAIRALKVQVTGHVKSIGDMKILSQTWNTVNDYLIALRAALPDVTQPHVKHTRITEAGGLLSMNRGELTEVLSYDTSPHWITGKNLTETLTVSTTTKGTNPITYVLQHDPKTQRTNVQQVQCKKKLMTYDIAYAGPRNRFTIATDAGNLIVHNCGYGMGAIKFKTQLKTFGVDIEEAEAARIIQVYRETYPRITKLWREAGRALDAIAEGKTCELGRANILTVDGEKGIRMPNGLYIKYPNLRKQTKEDGKDEYVYDTKKGKAVIPNRIYGGKVVENLCQGLARIIIGEQMLRIAKKYKVVMTVHDAIAIIAPEDEAQTAQDYVELCMRIRPEWALELPLNCESGVGKSYGEC
jgi:DNA polymerase I-like protein with 3'-5' exonuclease and polymerase domains